METSKDREPPKTRNFAYVKAKYIHPSTIIPERRHDEEIADSVKTVGVQQPLIVRRLASNPEEYELLDGKGRLDALDPEDEVCVDIREATDHDAFRTSEATSKRTQRNTRENAAYYTTYLETVKRERGEKGALARVAAETKISESELSQYVAINKLFLTLHQLDPELEFRKLDAMGINKLYKLAELADSTTLLDAAKQIERKADTITLEALSTIVNNLKGESPQERAIRMLDEPAECTSDELKEDNAFKTRFKDTTGRIADMKKKCTNILENIDTEKLPTTESTLTLLEKMLVSYRRLAYYGNKLREAQGGSCPKTDQIPA